ncbi:MAG TPA: hypothetical protein VKV73_26465 [Chloroflexota bacterium]|nr:hypothetical protein [Chloroflexota bacterium]
MHAAIARLVRDVEERQAKLVERSKGREAQHEKVWAKKAAYYFNLGWHLHKALDAAEKGIE